MEWGGSTEADSVPARGPSPVPTGERGYRPGGERGRILVCDDTEQIRRLIRLNLELEGYEVVEAEDGPAAMAILEDLTQPLPDVITLDVVMPRGDGWWMVSAIRADPRLADIPIVMVTASAQDSDRAHAVRAAVDGFVTKPFDPQELLTRVETLVAAHRP
ncbi:MAG: response regulator [Actinomycetota bacterium]